jgi:hypothetical protein
MRRSASRLPGLLGVVLGQGALLAAPVVLEVGRSFGAVLGVLRRLDVRQCGQEAQMAEKFNMEINAELMEEVRRLAEEQGRSEVEVVEDAVRSYVVTRFRHPDVLFGRIDRWQIEQGVDPLSEEEAIRLADEELHNWRRERRSAR